MAGEQAAAFYTSDRVKHLNTATVVQRSGDSVVFKRTSDGSSERTLTSAW